MANSPNTGSTLTVAGSNANKTSTAISTNMIILVNNTPVGAIQQMQISEKRDIKMIDEIGTDGHIDSTPNKSTDISGSCQRVRYDRLRVTEAFSRGFVHAASQVYPFDIVVLDRQKKDQGSQISTVIKNVWITGIDTTLSASDWVIVDNMSWVAETMFSVLNNGSSTPVAVGGELGVPHLGFGPYGTGVTDIEQLVDTGAGGRRGSMDHSGIIDLANLGDLF